MSNQQTEEEIVSSIVTRENSVFGMRRDGVTILKEAMKEHTNQRLSELRERVNKLRTKVEGGLVQGIYTKVYINKDDVLDLIDELTEHNQ